MTVYDQVVSVVTQYNQGVAESTISGEVQFILVTKPLFILSAIGLFFASWEFLSQQSDKRSILRCITVFLITVLLCSPVVHLYQSSTCDGNAIYYRVSTVGRLCGARGGGQISLKPLFDGRIKVSSPPRVSENSVEVINAIDALISLTIKESIMGSVTNPSGDTTPH